MPVIAVPATRAVWFIVVENCTTTVHPLGNTSAESVILLTVLVTVEYWKSKKLGFLIYISLLLLPAFIAKENGKSVLSLLLPAFSVTEITFVLPKVASPLSKEDDAWSKAKGSTAKVTSKNWETVVGLSPIKEVDNDVGLEATTLYLNTFVL